MKINGTEVSLTDARQIYMANARDWFGIAAQREDTLRKRAAEIAYAWKDAALAIDAGMENSELFRQYAVERQRAYPKS